MQIAVFFVFFFLDLSGNYSMNNSRMLGWGLAGAAALGGLYYYQKQKDRQPPHVTSQVRAAEARAPPVQTNQARAETAQQHANQQRVPASGPAVAAK